MAITFKAGEFNLDQNDLDTVNKLIKQASSGTAEDIKRMKAAISTPIIQVSNYEETFGDIWIDQTVGENEDFTYPIDSYDILAWELSADGEMQAVQLGLKWARAQLYRYQTGFEIHEDTLARATWGIIDLNVKRAGEALARKRDEKSMALLNTAASSLSGHVINSTGGVLTKAAVDSVFAAAARIGYRITRVKINSGDVRAMSSWSGVVFQEAPAIAEEIFRRGFLGRYLNADWQESPFVPGYVAGQQEGSVYFLAEPLQLGYRIFKGGIRAKTDTNVRNGLMFWGWDQRVGMNVVNPYGVFKIRIIA